MLWGAYYRVHTTSMRRYADHLEKSQTHLWSDKKITSHLERATAYESLLMPYANNKHTNQPANLRSLISAFVIRCLDSMISLVFCICNFMSLVCFCSWAGRFEPFLVANLRRQVFSWRGSNYFAIDTGFLGNTEKNVCLCASYNLPTCLIIGTKHDFLWINICWAPR